MIMGWEYIVRYIISFLNFFFFINCRIGDNPFCNIDADLAVDICGADAYAARCFCSQNCSDLPACNQGIHVLST